MHKRMHKRMHKMMFEYKIKAMRKGCIINDQDILQKPHPFAKLKSEAPPLPMNTLQKPGGAWGEMVTSHCISSITLLWEGVSTWHFVHMSFGIYVMTSCYGNIVAMETET